MMWTNKSLKRPARRARSSTVTMSAPPSLLRSFAIHPSLCGLLLGAAKRILREEEETHMLVSLRGTHHAPTPSPSPVGRRLFSVTPSSQLQQLQRTSSLNFGSRIDNTCILNVLVYWLQTRHVQF